MDTTVKPAPTGLQHRAYLAGSLLVPPLAMAYAFVQVERHRLFVFLFYYGLFVTFGLSMLSLVLMAAQVGPIK